MTEEEGPCRSPQEHSLTMNQSRITEREQQQRDDADVLLWNNVEESKNEPFFVC